MAKPATKIWCPKCHKRHRLPANAGGMTLRCRGCKYAFRVQDGLTSDPGPAIDVIPVAAKDQVTVPSAVVSAAPISSSSGSLEEVKQAVVAAQQETIEVPVTLDDDYDDILDVLETPDEDPLAPPRAIAKQSASSSSADQVSNSNVASPPTVVREPVTREQLRSHRNSRQFWMIISCVFACLLGLCSLFAVNLFMNPTLSQWERKMLYAFGVPARLLPPQIGEDELLLPPNHVQLLGDHVELADRNDFFRDEFPEVVVADAENVGRAEADVRGGDDLRDEPRAVPEPKARAVPPTPRIARRPRPRPNRGRGRNRQPNNRNAWKPPELSPAEIQLVATRGIDPKTLKLFTVDTDHEMNVAFVRDTVFSMAQGNKLSVFNMDSNSVVASRKLDKEVAAICGAIENEITHRPAAWVLYQSGKLEKWEVRGGELNRELSVLLRPVFKEDQVSIAAGKSIVAYHVDQQIVITRILETGSKVDFTKECSVDADVLAMRFSADDSQLMAIVGEEALLIDTGSGNVISRSDLPESVLVVDVARSWDISADLSTAFVCQNGLVGAWEISSGSGAGQYWPSTPVPLRSVVVNQNQLLGLTEGSPSQATMFAVTNMERIGGDDRPRAAGNGRAKGQGDLLGNKAANPVDDRTPFLLQRSPAMAAPIQSVQALPDNRIAFLTNEAGGNRIGIATWKNGWSVVSLSFQPGTRISNFAFSNDLSKVAIVSQDIVQGWEVVDLAAGTVKFVSESAGHVDDVTEVAFTEDSQQVVSGDESGRVLAWNFDDGKQVGGVEGFKTMIKGIVTRGDGGFVAMDQRGIARGSAHSNRSKIKPFNRTISGATALSDNGNRIAFLLGSNVNIADVNNQKVIGTLKPATRPQSILFSKDQKYLVLQSADEVTVWDWRRGVRERVYRFAAGSSREALAFDRSIDGKTIAIVTGSKQNQISIFELPGDSNDKK